MAAVNMLMTLTSFSLSLSVLGRLYLLLFARFESRSLWIHNLCCLLLGDFGWSWCYTSFIGSLSQGIAGLTNFNSTGGDLLRGNKMVYRAVVSSHFANAILCVDP